MGQELWRHRWPVFRLGVLRSQGARPSRLPRSMCGFTTDPRPARPGPGCKRHVEPRHWRLHHRRRLGRTIRATGLRRGVCRLRGILLGHRGHWIWAARRLNVAESRTTGSHTNGTVASRSLSSSYLPSGPGCHPAHPVREWHSMVGTRRPCALAVYIALYSKPLLLRFTSYHVFMLSRFPSSELSSTGPPGDTTLCATLRRGEVCGVAHEVSKVCHVRHFDRRRCPRALRWTLAYVHPEHVRRTRPRRGKVTEAQERVPRG